MLIFIGSSTEATKAKPSPVTTVADWIRETENVPLRWDGVGVFPSGSILISRILELGSDVDAAVFIYDGSDKVCYHGDMTTQPRDNVLIEVGAFSRALGIDRTIICCSGKPKVASDLGGIVYLNLEDPAAEARFKAWIEYISSRPKEPHVIDENAMLRLALAEIAFKNKGKAVKATKATLKKGKPPNKVLLISIVETVVIRHEMVDWTFVTARQIMEWVSEQFPAQAEKVYWHLVVHGIIRFRDIDQFWDDDDSWANSVDYAMLSERGKTFFMHLQRRDQLTRLEKT